MVLDGTVHNVKGVFFYFQFSYKTKIVLAYLLKCACCVCLCMCVLAVNKRGSSSMSSLYAQSMCWCMCVLAVNKRGSSSMSSLYAQNDACKQHGLFLFQSIRFFCPWIINHLPLHSNMSDVKLCVFDKYIAQLHTLCMKQVWSCNNSATYFSIDSFIVFTVV